MSRKHRSRSKATWVSAIDRTNTRKSLKRERYQDRQHMRAKAIRKV